MIANLQKIKIGLEILRFLPQTLWFNFHYLKFRDALKLPILLYKPKLLCCKGKIKINAPIRFGMIQLGFNKVSIYPNTGIKWENRGLVEFNGKIRIGNASAISVGETGRIRMGNNFVATCSLKLVCYNNIKFSDNVLVGWDCLFSDTDFHAIQTPNGLSKGYSPIEIGDNNWFAMQTVCLKGTKTPSYCISAARSLLNKDYSIDEEKIMLSGSPAVVVKRDVYHDWINDKIEYKNPED